MRKMVPSEALKNAYLDIEQTILQVDKTGWQSETVGGVNCFSKAVDITNLNIHDSDIVIVTPYSGWNDSETLTMQAIKDGLLLALEGTATIYCESLVNPSTYQNQATTIEIQITIFRHSTL